MIGWLGRRTQGLTLGLRAQVRKDVRTRTRGWRSMWLVTGYLAALTVGTTGFLVLYTKATVTIVPTLGAQVFSMLGIGAILLLSFITPALTVGAISGERERRTLDLLLVTRASSLGLAAGKLTGALVYIFYLQALSLPAFGLVYLFGGVPLQTLALVLTVIAVTAVTHAALGLLMSALVKRTLLATMLTYLIILFIVVGIPLISAVFTIARSVQSGPPQAPGLPPFSSYFSPLLSLGSVLPASPDGFGLPLAGSLTRAVMMGGMPGPAGMGMPSGSLWQSVYVTQITPDGQPVYGTTWAPWVHYVALSGVVTLLSLLTSALAISPTAPWKRRWRRHRAAPARPGIET